MLLLGQEIVMAMPKLLFPGTELLLIIVAQLSTHKLIYYLDNNIYTMKISSSTTASDKYNLLGRKVMQVSLLLAVVGYSFFLFNEDQYSYTNDLTEAGRRSMLATDTDTDDNVQGEVRRRRLVTTTRNGLSPPTTDVADDLYIVKPVVGYATIDVLEPTTDNGPTLLELPIDGHTASSSTSPYLPSNAADGILSTFWRSGRASSVGEF